MSRPLALRGAAELPCRQEEIGDDDPVRRGTQGHNLDRITYDSVYEKNVHNRREVETVAGSLVRHSGRPRPYVTM
jgi:hypothetical protein